MASSVQELESVTSQVYGNPNAPNKTELEQYLTRIRNEATVKHVQYYLSNSSNHYLLWYTLTIAENLTQNRWDSLSSDDKESLRKFLLEYLVTNYSRLPPFISTKLMKVIVLVAKLDWPNNYPSYIPTLQQYIQNSDTCEIGIQLFKITGEEFIGEAAAVSSQRKAQLKVSLQAEVPKFLEYLYSILSISFLSNTAKISNDSPLYKSNFDKRTKKLIKLILETFMQYFSWSSLNESIIKLDYISILFGYSKLLKSNSFKNGKLSITSLSCLNEILSKNYVPNQYKDFITLFFNNSCEILLNPTCFTQDYHNKFIQLLELFISNHTHRIEALSLPIIDMLSLVFKYTFMNEDMFASILQVWNMLLDNLLSMKEQKNNAYEKYMGGMVALANEVVKKLLYSYNANVLNGLSNEIDEKSPSEEQKVSELEEYVVTCIELIAKIAELYTPKVFGLLNPLFVTQLEKFSATSSNASEVVIKDLTVLIRIITRLEEHFVNDFNGYFDFGKFILHRILDLTQFSAQNQLYMRAPYWEDMTVMCIQSISGFMSWIVMCEAHAKNVPQINSEYVPLLSKIVEIMLLLLSNKAPDMISMSCCRVLKSIAVTVRPASLLNLPPIQSMYNNATAITEGLPIKIQSQVFVILSMGMLCVPSGVNPNKEQWDSIHAKYAQFFTPLVSKFISIPQSPNFVQSNAFTQVDVMYQIQKYCEIIKGVIEAVSTESKTQKTIVFETFKPVLPVIIPLFTLYTSQPQILSYILELFTSIFESLKLQVGSDFIQQTVSSFLPLLSVDKLAAILDSKGSNAIVKLIQIFTIIFEDPTSTFDKFIIPVYKLVTEQIFPHAKDLDIKLSIYKLLYTLLLQKSKHFTADPNLYMATMQYFIEAIANQDINISKQSLTLLDSLNEKQRLYSTLIRTPCYTPLLNTLFSVLFNKMHNILKEDLIATIYKAVSVNFNVFYNQFLVTLLGEFPMAVQHSLMQIFQGERDQITFTDKLNQFVNDFMYYRQSIVK